MVEIAASSTDAHNSKIAPIVVNPVKGSPSGAALANAANLVPPQKSNGKQGSSTTTATTATTAITATVTPAVNTAATPATVSRLAEMAAKMSMSNSTSPASSSDRLNHLHVPSTHHTHTHTHTHTHVRDDDDETHSCSASYAGDDYERLGKHQAACRFFDDFLANEENNNLARGSDIANFLKQCGFLKDDPRFSSFYQDLLVDDHQYRTDISVDDFISMIVKSQQVILFERAFRGQDLVCPDFQDFAKLVKEIFESVRRDVSEKVGATASYIPQLGEVDPSLYGISICTVDGQRFEYGHSQVKFCVQSCIKPLTYGMAMEEFGQEKVHNHVGREPSGVAFNSLCLNTKNLPHNPMINAGAIMCCSLVKPQLPLHQRFEHVVRKLDDLSGGFNWGFSNSVYLSEKETADKNFCLAYMMRGQQAFPENTDMAKTLDFYFQCCSLETDCNKVAVAAATIANGGVCPLTNKKVFERETCRNILSMMYSCGMYDYSGEWAFTIGIPAKSGVSGCIYAIIPEFGSICIYGPPLDSIGNSVRGIEFFKRLVNQVIFHNFDSLSSSCDDSKKRMNPRRCKSISDRENKVAALYASAEGDLGQLRRLLLSGVPVSLADYDGRTLLHLACSEGHMAIVKYLVKIHHADMLVMDRWGGTPLSDAEKGGHVKVVAWLNKVSRWRELQHQRVSNGSASVLNHELHMSSGGEEEK